MMKHNMMNTKLCGWEKTQEMENQTSLSSDDNLCLYQFIGVFEFLLKLHLPKILCGTLW